MYGLTLASGPAEEPVTTAELKTWLRVEHSSDDTLIDSLGKTARILAERLIGRQMVTASWILSLDGFPWPGGWAFLENPMVFPDPHTILLPKAPLASVSSVTYYDIGNTLRTLSSSVYVVDAATDPGRIVLGMGQVWPVTRLRPGAVRVTFSAGYGGASAVPEDLKTAIKIATAFWYENRGEEVAANATKLPMAAESLLLANWNGALEYGA